MYLNSFEIIFSNKNQSDKNYIRYIMHPQIRESRQIISREVK